VVSKQVQNLGWIVNDVAVLDHVIVVIDEAVIEYRRGHGCDQREQAHNRYGLNP
jgi:hypothetical protein